MATLLSFVIFILILDSVPTNAYNHAHVGRFKRSESQGVLAKLGINRSVNIYDNVVKELGKGAFGIVDLVLLPPKVAVKKILQKELAKDKSAQLFLKSEIEAYLACGSPFVVKMYDVFEDQENVYIVMESIENGSLVKLLEDKCGETGLGLPEDFVQFYVAQAFLALNHLHSKGYTHNDSHNDNFLLDTQGFLKLIDLGLAFKFSEFKDPVKKKAYIGKENSMPFRGWYFNRAPERIKLEEYGPSSDYWALGLLAYRLAFGKNAFIDQPAKENETKEEKAARWKKEEEIIIKGEYTMPETPQISEHLKDFIKRLLIVNPEDRLGHANPDDIKRHKLFTSVNFNWNALEKKDTVHFQKYLLPSTVSTSIEIKEFFKKIGRKMEEKVKMEARKLSPPGKKRTRSAVSTLTKATLAQAAALSNGKNVMTGNKKA